MVSQNYFARLRKKKLNDAPLSQPIIDFTKLFCEIEEKETQ